MVSQGHREEEMERRDEFGRKRSLRNDDHYRESDDGTDRRGHRHHDHDDDIRYRRDERDYHYYGSERHYHQEDKDDNPDRVVRAGQVVQGRVGRVEGYGAFVDFDSGKNHHYRGLIHISQLSKTRVEKVEDVVRMGDEVYAVVLEVEGDPHQRPRIRLSLVGVDQVSGELDASVREGLLGPDHRNFHHGGGGSGRPIPIHVMERRAMQRQRMFKELVDGCSWRGVDRDARHHRGPPVPDSLRNLWSSSPSPPVHKKENKTTKEESSSRDESSSLGSESESSSDSESSMSSSSEDSRRRRRKPRYSRSRRSSSSRRDRRRRHRRRRSPSTSSSSSSSSSGNSSSSRRSDSESSDDESHREKRARTASRSASPAAVKDSASHQSSALPTLDEDDLREAQDFKGAVQGAHQDTDDDEDDIGPKPLPQSQAAASGGKSAYGGALLPGEGQAIAQYVQQNLRIPRRGEIGYTADAIEHWEKSGFVMSGSRHARMNAVRIRKENQVYSAEEQRALALITMEENQQKEAQLLQDFRTMLKDKQKLRERAEEGAKEE